MLTIFCGYSYSAMLAEAYTRVLFKPLTDLDVPAESQDKNLSSEHASTQFQCEPLLEKWDWATPSMCHIFTNPCTVSGHPLMPICLAPTLTIFVWNLHKTDPHFWKDWQNRGTKLCIQEPFQDKLNKNRNRERRKKK